MRLAPKKLTISRIRELLADHEEHQAQQRSEAALSATRTREQCAITEEVERAKEARNTWDRLQRQAKRENWTAAGWLYEAKATLMFDDETLQAEFNRRERDENVDGYWC